MLCDRSNFVNDRVLLAFVGGLALALCLAPGGGALVSAPAPLTGGAAVALLILAYRGAGVYAPHAATVCGAIAGCCVAVAGAPVLRDVEMHAPRGHGAADLFDALDALDSDPRALQDRELSVTGSWTPRHDGWPSSVSRRIMTCCAADAVDVGFDVEPRGAVALRAGTWVRVTGRVRVTLRDGDVRYELAVASVIPAVATPTKIPS